VRVTSNWLIGLTRYQEVINAFPWMNTLANKYRVNTGKGCGGCGQQKVIRAVTDHVNDTMRILATIPEEDVARFKALTKQESLTITYFDTRGTQMVVTR